MNQMNKLISFLGIALLLTACNSVPDGVLKRNKMEQVLYEVHIAEAIIEEYPALYTSPESKQKLMASVFRDNGITKAEFDSSMVYYGAHLDQYMKIYQGVSARLAADKERAAEDLLAYERSLLSPVGDSANIWRRPTEVVLDPALLAATNVFEIKGDSNFHEGDRIVWNVQLQNLPADSLGYVYLSLGFKAKDSISQVEAFSANKANHTLELTLPTLSDKDRIFGAMAFLNRVDTLLSPVYVDGISMMRYRKVEPKAVSADSITTQVDSTTVQADSLKVALKKPAVSGAKMQMQTQIDK